MKQNYPVKALALLILAAAPAASFAQTPALINYQGRVQLGTPPVDVNGTGQFKFALVDQSPVPFVQATATVARAGANQNLTGATFNVTNGGTGYTTAPVVTVSAPQVGGGVQAVVAATVSGGSVTGFTVTTAGSGYTSNPTLTIAAPPAPTPTIIWNNNGPAPAAPIGAVSLPVTNGLYSVLLGDDSIANMAAIPSSVFSRRDLRLRVWFNNTQLSPDQRLAANGYVSSLPGLSIITSTTDKTATAALDLFANGGHLWRLRSVSGFGSTGVGNPEVSGPAGSFELIDQSTDLRAMTVLSDGRIGIGTTAPATKFHLSGSGSQELSLESTDATPPPPATTSGGRRWTLQSSGSSGNATLDGSFQIIDRTSNVNRLLIDATGNVGIGSIDPSRAKLVVEGASPAGYTIPQHGAFINAANPAVQIQSYPIPGNTVSIYANAEIHCPTFRAFSDARIKTIEGRSDGGMDLRTLLSVEVTDYHYKDTISKGSAPQKKVIAQQVEKVYPQAVSQTTDVVPDIYKLGAFKDGWIELKTDLKMGERVRLTDDKSTAVFEVLEATEGKFRTAFKPAGDKVFVFGREVKDFRAVDYEAIAMLNVSATQELARQLEAKSAEVLAMQKENAALKAALAGNAAKDQAQDEKLAAQNEKLAALAKLLESRAPAAAVTVSTQR